MPRSDDRLWGVDFDKRISTTEVTGPHMHRTKHTMAARHRISHKGEAIRLVPLRPQLALVGRLDDRTRFDG